MLLSALVFLFLLMLLSISALEMSLLEIKMSANLWGESRYFQAAESALRVGEKAVAENQLVSCFYAFNQGANFFKEKPLVWWLQHSCHEILGEITVHYVVEQIAEDPCVAAHADEKPGVRYYRVTARAINTKVSLDEVSGYSGLLQSTFAKLHPQSAVCETIRTVSLGRQSWREVF